jgi:hypothetical protein
VKSLLQVQRVGVQLSLPVAGGDRPAVALARLERAATAEQDELARWTAV